MTVVVIKSGSRPLTSFRHAHLPFHPSVMTQSNMKSSSNATAIFMGFLASRTMSPHKFLSFINYSFRHLVIPTEIRDAHSANLHQFMAMEPGNQTRSGQNSDGFHPFQQTVLKNLLSWRKVGNARAKWNIEESIWLMGSVI